ncbi:DNA repair protein RecN [Knoellia subterranea]|uniref:DNA repair protein RecN n=1 Tax=Knoellia subterranea KCTC 19937 TaxID=1385521 RepID=A0A0A0JFD1_9MICO|nr:DNA repair protein RecN [Knoellia subterranea]KGN36115.1 DNA repair protein RecN [Knoellia subterranea KCTC 19937]
MLQEIRIQDLGIIDESLIEFGPGLTVLTGETGAGKTMVVTSLGLLLGARSETGLVREGADRAVVEGVFDVAPDHPATVRATEAGGDVDESLVLVRTVQAEGRSRAHVGGRSAPVGVLGELGEHLVAVHGQADQWRLRRPEEHRELLDAFGGADLADVRTAYESVYAAHAAARAELESLRAAARERAQELDLLTRGLERLEAVEPQAGEDESLRVEDERLSHAEELRRGSSEAHDLLSGGDEADGSVDDGILGSLARARSALAQVSANDPALADLETRLTEISHLVTDLAADLSGYVADVDLDPGRLEWVQERRAALTELTRSYGDSVDDVIAWGERAAARAVELEGDDSRIEELERRTDELEAERTQAAQDLTQERRTVADALAERISDELSHLAMGSARVVIAVDPAGRLGPHGGDDVEIGLAANVGSTPRSVSKAASGGELSRVMLAIEVATAEATGTVPTFVFDEVDAGVGGRAALDVGARLAALARSAQVIVVTHLAQVAAHADHHLVVSKADDGHVTRSGVRRVEGDERVTELARMLAGTVSDAALEHARDLLAERGQSARA